MSNAAHVSYPQTTVINVGSSVHTTDGDSGSLDVSGFRYLLIGATCGSFTPANTLSLYLDGLGPDSNWYNLGSFGVGHNESDAAAFGPGTNNKNTFPDTVRLRWDLTGSSITSATFGYWVVGQA